MHIIITAGDPSADAHAARLMAAIRMQVPEVIFEGFGGPAMEMQGLRSIARLQDLAVTGFWEVAQRIRYFTKLLTRCADLLVTRKPQLFIPVDYPGFNMRLAAKAKASGVPVAWYIAPQLWAWGKNRATNLARIVDLLMVVFPFEVDFFRSYGIRTTWVGHPFVAPKQHRDADQEKTILLMPGSRTQELRHHVPILENVLTRLPDTLGFEPRVVVPRARLVSKGALASLETLGAEIVDDAHAAMQYSHAGLIKAGTSTLEAAMLDLPFATYYKTSWLSYTISKRLVNVDTVTMMNLLLHRNVASEFIQQKATPKELTNEISSLLTNTQRRADFLGACAEVRQLLGVDNNHITAADRAANAVAEFLQ